MQLEWRISIGRLDLEADIQAPSWLEGPASGKTVEAAEMKGGSWVFLFKYAAGPHAGFSCLCLPSIGTHLSYVPFP